MLGQPKAWKSVVPIPTMALFLTAMMLNKSELLFFPNMKQKQHHYPCFVCDKNKVQKLGQNHSLVGRIQKHIFFSKEHIFAYSLFPCLSVYFCESICCTCVHTCVCGILIWICTYGGQRSALDVPFKFNYKVPPSKPYHICSHSFRFMAPFFISCYYMYVCGYVCIFLNITCLIHIILLAPPCVFRTDDLSLDTQLVCSFLEDHRSCTQIYLTACSISRDLLGLFPTQFGVFVGAIVV